MEFVLYVQREFVSVGTFSVRNQAKEIETDF